MKRTKISDKKIKPEGTLSRRSENKFPPLTCSGCVVASIVPKLLSTLQKRAHQLEAAVHLHSFQLFCVFLQTSPCDVCSQPGNSTPNWYTAVSEVFHLVSSQPFPNWSVLLNSECPLPNFSPGHTSVFSAIPQS